MKPDKLGLGRIDATEWEWGDDVFAELNRITTEKAESIVAESLGKYCEEHAPMIDFKIKPNGLLYMDFCIWFADDPPFVATYRVDKMLDEIKELNSPAVMNALKRLIEKY